MKPSVGRRRTGELASPILRVPVGARTRHMRGGTECEGVLEPDVFQGSIRGAGLGGGGEKLVADFIPAYLQSYRCRIGS